MPNTLSFIPVAKLHVSALNTRTAFGSTNENADGEWDQFVASIAAHGILQPLLVRETPDGPTPYQVIAGKRRFTAAQHAELHEVPALIHSGMDSDESTTQAMLIENLQRKSFDPIEEAHGYRWLMAHGMTESQVCAAVKVQRSHLTRRTLLLDLPPTDQAAVRAGQLAKGPAQRRALCYRWIADGRRKIAAHPDHQITAAHDYQESREYFDSFTHQLLHTLPFLELDQRPSDGELARTVPPERRSMTWRDLISGSEAGESIKIIRVISPDWRQVELADAPAVKAFIRANTPGHLRKDDTNIAHAEKEAAQFAHVIWDHAAALCLTELEKAGVSRFDQQTLRTTLIACCSRQDLDFLARRAKIQDVHLAEPHDLRRQILTETQSTDFGTLMLGTLMLITARRDSLRLPDHPAAHPLLDALGIDPTTLSDRAIQTVTDALKARK